MSVLVVISHYNARPADDLIALLDQTTAVPAGMPFDCCVVVNRAEPVELSLPERHRAVTVLYRENTGYNLGAWEHGWRHMPPFDCYLFLQDECRIARPNWVAAFVKTALRPRVGVVGEMMHWRGLGWASLDEEYRRIPPRATPGGDAVPYPHDLRAGLAAAGIPEGKGGAHLQSLMLCMRRSVLEAVGGFRIGRTYADAVLAEIAVTKQVEALGLKAHEVGPGSFRYIVHPQWAGRQGIKRAIGRYILGKLPSRLANRIRSSHDRGGEPVA